MDRQIHRTLPPPPASSVLLPGPCRGARPLGSPLQSGQGWGGTGEGPEGTWEASSQLLSQAKIKEGAYSAPVCFREHTWPAATPRLTPPGTYRQDKCRERGELAGVSVDPLLQLQDGPRLKCSTS